MFKLIWDTFRSTNEGIILATPLVLFLWLLSIYMSYSGSVVDTLPELALFLVTIIFMVSAFCSGWFYMTKKCVEFSKKNFILDEDRASESLKLIQAFPVGIGKYFLSYIFVTIIFMLGVFIVTYITYNISIPLIRDLNLSVSQMSAVITSAQEKVNFFNSLTKDQVMILLKVNFYFTCVSLVYFFLIMLWMPEIVYKDRNPLLGLFTSIGKLFSKFGKSLFIYVYISLVNLLILFFSTFLFWHPIAYMVITIVHFYFMVYAIVLIFSYYDKEFNESYENKTESDSNSRSDS